MLITLFFQGLPENYAPLLVENIKKNNFTHIIAGHSAFGKNLMPRVAALMDCSQISDITAVESEDSESFVPEARTFLVILKTQQHSSAPYMQVMPYVRSKHLMISNS